MLNRKFLKHSVRKICQSSQLLYGQPNQWTHPHLIEPGNITFGTSKEMYANRRRELQSKLPGNALVVIPAYKNRYSSQNIFYPFHQSNNLLYLSGFLEPEACLVMYRGEWIMFLRENEPNLNLWEGPVSGCQQAKSFFGMDNAYSMNLIEEYLKTFMKNSAILYTAFDENICCPEIFGPLLSLVTKPSHDIKPILESMRVRKRAEEIRIMAECTKISSEAFTRTMKWSISKFKQCHNKFFSESQVAAKMEYVCRLNGTQGLAYVPVVASGARANILHYTRNDMQIRANDLILMDAGGKFHGYCADITRSWPISGIFSCAQRKIYEAVLRVQESCIKACKSSESSLDDLYCLSIELMADEIGKLGFSNPLKHVHRLYPHNIGHFIGLDLHDCPNVNSGIKLEKGMAFTIEPGLYIPYDYYEAPEELRGIGIRIEDDIVISLDTGLPTVMSEGTPKQLYELENILNNNDNENKYRL